LFHLGYVEGCLGRRDAQAALYRQALGTNPHFSLLWAPIAREALR
jgi:hypothetical protein